MIKKIRYILLLLFFAPSLMAIGAGDDSVAFISLSGNVFSDKTLTKDRYLIQNNLRVAKEATLTIEQGAELVFNPGTEIVILGGLKINGKPNNFVKLYSLNSTNEGVGISFISANSSAFIEIEYADFAGLIRPLTFDNNWYRGNVSITNSQFRNINNNDAGIMIGVAEHLKNKEKINFEFSQNIFSDNLSSITLKTLSSYNVNYKFTNNLITNNTFYDYKPRAKDNPVNGELDAEVGKAPIVFENNVLLGNYVMHEYADTIIDFCGVGIEGTAQNAGLANNYWGKGVDDEKATQFTYGFHKDKFAPAVDVSPILKAIPTGVHAFIENVEYSGSQFNPYLPVTNFIGNELTLTFSKKIAPKQQPLLIAVYLDTAIGRLFSQPITDFNFSYSAGAKQAKLTIQKVAGIEHGFYLVFAGLRDEEGFELPCLNLGKLFLNRLHGDFKTSHKIDLEIFFANANRWKTPPPTDGVIETVDPKLKELEKKTHTYEFGLMLGVTNYFGDLSTNEFNREEINTAYGLRFRYNFAKRLSFRTMFTYAHLSGNDTYSSDPLRRKRNLNFKSPLYDFTLQLEYHLNHYVFSDKNRFVPSIGTGLTLFHFNPQATYNGQTYNLHSIGTEGQTSGQAKKYRLTQLALPISASFKTMLGYHFVVELEMNYVKTFTDYLDDVSDKYANIQKVQDANPSVEGNTISSMVDPSGGRFKEGSQRGDPRHKDWYLLLGLSLSYRF
jgi:hypothetical protein